MTATTSRGSSTRPASATLNHGPVDVEVIGSSFVRLVSFTGSEESDVLHAAGSWVTEHHNDVIVLGINWYSDLLSPNDFDPPGGLRHRLDLTVDASNE